VAGYRVFRDGNLIGTTGATELSVTGLTPGQEYCFRVAALDGAGNVSGLSAMVCATTTAYESPVGTWEIVVRGRLRGTVFVTFQEDFTVAGLGMMAGQCGYFALTGTWQFDESRGFTCSFTRTVEDDACGSADPVGGALSGKVSRGRLAARGVEGETSFAWRGAAVSDFPDLAGHWQATVVRGREATTEDCDLTATASGALYTLAGEAAGNEYTLEGVVLVDSRNRLVGYVIRHEADGDVVGLYTGRVQTRDNSLRLTGRDLAGLRHRLTVVPDAP
jgi:hypothetical protein